MKSEYNNSHPYRVLALKILERAFLDYTSPMKLKERLKLIEWFCSKECALYVQCLEITDQFMDKIKRISNYRRGFELNAKVLATGYYIK